MSRRYEGWHHTRFEGDVDAGKALLPLARKVLGFAHEQAAVNGLGTYKHVHRLPDGGLIVAEKVGEIPRVSIFVPPSGDERRRRTVEGFVLSWGPGGEDWNPVLFAPPPEDPPEDDEGASDWKAMFFSADSLGYAETPENRRGASYRDVFGTKARVPPGEHLAPTNGMWTHPQTGEVVGWFRGYTGYWPEHYRHPVTNYANWVTIYGHPVLVLDGSNRVLAAAMRDGWLYVLVGENLGALNPSLPFDPPSHSGQVWYSQPYGNDEYSYALYRMRLAVKVQPETGIEAYEADFENAELLARENLRRAYGAWSFNADCTEVVTIQLPRLAVFGWVYEIEGSDWVPSPAEQSFYPTSEAQRISFTIQHGTIPPTVVLQTAPAPDLIAEEDGHTLSVFEHTRTLTYGRVDYVLDDFEVPAVEFVRGGGVEWYERRVMLFAHLPTQTLLVHRWRTDVQPSRYVSAGFQLFVAGVEVPLDDPMAIEQAFAPVSFDSTIASNFYLQKGVGYDDGVGTSWYRPMDGMSFLLGFTFGTQGALSALGTPAAPNYGYQSCPHYGFTYTGTNNPAGSAAGGYVFGSVGGPANEQFWGPSFPFAAPYGANNGAFEDNAPSPMPVTNYLGAAAAHAGNVLVGVGLQPMLGVAIGGAPSGLAALANQNRYIHAGTNGDAATVLSAAVTPAGGAPWRRYTLAHTGAPRPRQRGSFHAS